MIFKIFPGVLKALINILSLLIYRSTNFHLSTALESCHPLLSQNDSWKYPYLIPLITCMIVLEVSNLGLQGLSCRCFFIILIWTCPLALIGSSDRISHCTGFLNFSLQQLFHPGFLLQKGSRHRIFPVRK